MATSKQLLFEDICSQDFLSFKFGERGYQDQLNDSIAKTSLLAAVKVELVNVSINESETQSVVWAAHNFGFLGGSLGCAEGEKLTRAFEYALEHRLPVCVQCRSGGARMQEGTSSLMQMAKVSVAVQALQNAGLPFISVLCDPTYGGVSASYAMQADVRMAVDEEADTDNVSEARIGFAGPAVILNTMCEANQAKFDQQCPSDFQFASFVLKHGQVDLILQTKKSEAQKNIELKVANIANLILKNTQGGGIGNKNEVLNKLLQDTPEDEKKAAERFNYTRSRLIDRPQTQDLIHGLFDNYIELSGDGKVGKDACLRGGIASFHGTSCVVIATYKGHTPTDMQNANYGMPSPHGYRTALRLMKLAERFQMPVVTFVDTVGAWPTFECERDGQSEAIATNLTAMAGLKVPIITLMVGEGGSGGALGICMGNMIAMLSGGYFGVISPEGAASILGRYKDDQHKALQFPKDCQALATAQCIYAHQLKDLGVVDFIIWEDADLHNGSAKHTDTVLQLENYQSFPHLKQRIHNYIEYALSSLVHKSAEDLVKQRYQKYRALGTFAVLNEEERTKVIEQAKQQASGAKKAVAKGNANTSPSLLCLHLAEETVLGGMSKYRKLSPATMSKPLTPASSQITAKYSPKPLHSLTMDNREACKSAKAVLDTYGVDYLCKQWLPNQAKHRVLLTDTTMRDAHQSLLATRVRTLDIIQGALLASNLLEQMFSLECWGGATFDVCMRFLDECPWERLRAIRKACPNICLQMLIRGANAVGYTSYADNVVEEFIALAAQNGMDVFRIFDCFNIVDNMRVSINAVKKTGKVAEVAICYTGNVLTSSIYTLAYYEDLAREIKGAGADILCVKDMAGLLRPLEVESFMAALRRGAEGLPIHFHTHATSSGSLATCMEMARVGCEVIDFATASMADGTSQPSLNTFLAMMQGAKNDPGINYLDIEPYDLYWAGIRDLYSPFESGMKSGTARVFEHQIPGGQYSNLLVQSNAMGLSLDQWSAVLDAYRDVNMLFGDIVKVTPSSKCVGDLAIFLVMKGLKTSDLVDPVTGQIHPTAHLIDLPASIVGLFKGDLGFPHRGFPEGIEKLVLKGAEKRKERAGLQIAPVNFEVNLKTLEEKFSMELSMEDGMSYLMYPQVFTDYINRKLKKGPLLTKLPTPVYLYALSPGDIFDMIVEGAEVGKVFSCSLPSTLDPLALYTVRMELIRVSSIAHMHRTVSFKLILRKDEQKVLDETQHVLVKDTGGVFVFEGPMVDTNKPLDQIGSPMAGVVEKVMVKVGDNVKAGDVLALVSAMKMEVKVTAPREGVVKEIAVPAPGYRVVEGALLVML